MSETKKLYRDPKNGKILGVCAGLAAYFGADVTIIRVIAVVLALTGGGGLLAYFIAAIVMPVKPDAPAK